MKNDQLYHQLEQIDTKILQLLEARMKVVDLSAHTGESIVSLHGPESLLQNLPEDVDPAHRRYMKMLLLSITEAGYDQRRQQLQTGRGPLAKSIVHALQEMPHLTFPRKAVVAVPGVQGSFAHAAAQALFSSPEYMYCVNFQGILNAVDKKLCNFGILPIESSKNGTSSTVYRLLQEHGFHIARCAQVRTRYSLLSREDTKASLLREIFAHSQAVGECSTFLRGFANVKITVCSSDTQAIMRAMECEHPHVAAIAPDSLVDRYELHTLEDAIENSRNNFTRFACVSKNPLMYPGADKISLAMAIPDARDILFTLTQKFVAMDMHLEKVERRTSNPDASGASLYLDLKGALDTPGLTSLLEDLAAGPEKLSFLGYYQDVVPR